MKILTYFDMNITVVKQDANPGAITKLACDHTMLKNIDPIKERVVSPELLRFLITAEHTSVLEHCNITFAISNVSRSLMAQLTRHRIGSFTCKSQHYQDHSEAPVVIRKNTEPSFRHYRAYECALTTALDWYEFLLENGQPKEEARQVLPNAIAVNILWTANARSLLGFLRQRLCRRNVLEMQVFAYKIQTLCKEWWPELFIHSGPPCKWDMASCNQGKMKAEACK